MERRTDCLALYCMDIGDTAPGLLWKVLGRFWVTVNMESGLESWVL